MTNIARKTNIARDEHEVLVSLVRIRRLADHGATLQESLRAEILKAREVGGTLREISEASGVPRETLRRWVHRATENGSDS